MGKKGANPTATMGETVKVPTILDVASGNGKVLTMVEVDPATENPALLDAIRYVHGHNRGLGFYYVDGDGERGGFPVDRLRFGEIRKKNSAALTSILDPRDDPSTKDSSNAADAVWYLGINGCHITGNLNLLTDIKPVYDRWVKSLNGGPLMQVCARGSVNCNGIKLDDVWYVPGVIANVVAVAHFSDQELKVSMGGGGCSIERPDGTVLGKGHRKDRLYELDFLNITSVTPWYIVSNAAEHMTGNLHLLTNFTATRPGHLVRTHTGEMLQVCGKGSLSSTQLAVPGVSYVPGLTENIISVTQLTDSGFSVSFGPHGCTVTRNRDGAKVGYAYHAGSQLYRLDYLRVAVSK